jgi:hypothetical protein
MGIVGAIGTVWDVPLGSKLLRNGKIRVQGQLQIELKKEKDNSTRFDLNDDDRSFDVVRSVW